MAPVDWSTLAVEEGSSPSDYWTPRQCVEHVVGGSSVATQWLGLGTMPSVCMRTRVYGQNCPLRVWLTVQGCTGHTLHRSSHM